MRLAEQTGCLDVDSMLDSMTPRQWEEWQAKQRIEPAGVRGVEIILARIGEMIAGFLGYKITQRDLMPWLYPTDVKEQTQLTPKQSRVAIMAELRRAAGGS